MAALPPNQAPPQFSPDGRWWWDGQRWIPIPPTQPSPAAAPVGQVSLAKKTGDRAAQLDRFGRHPSTILRLIRYLLLADVLVAIVLFLWDSSTRAFILGPLAYQVLFAVPVAPLLVLMLVCVVGTSTSREVFVNVAPERFFALITDPQTSMRHGTFSVRYRGVEEIEPTASGGTKGRFRLSSFGLPAEVTWEMLEYEPPRRVVSLHRTIWIGITIVTSLTNWSLAPTDGGTRVDYESESRRFDLWPTSAFNRTRLSRATDRALALLKAQAEQPA